MSEKKVKLPKKPKILGTKIYKNTFTIYSNLKKVENLKSKRMQFFKKVILSSMIVLSTIVILVNNKTDNIVKSKPDLGSSVFDILNINLKKGNVERLVRKKKMSKKVIVSKSIDSKAYDKEDLNLNEQVALEFEEILSFQEEYQLQLRNEINSEQLDEVPEIQNRLPASE